MIAFGALTSMHFNQISLHIQLTYHPTNTFLSLSQTSSHSFQLFTFFFSLPSHHCVVEILYGNLSSTLQEEECCKVWELCLLWSCHVHTLLRPCPYIIHGLIKSSMSQYHTSIMLNTQRSCYAFSILLTKNREGQELSWRTPTVLSHHNCVVKSC